MQNPVSPGACILLATLQGHCHGLVTLSGSSLPAAVLYNLGEAEYLRTETLQNLYNRAENNDVDFFVPQYPDAMLLYCQYGTKMYMIGPHFDRILDEVFKCIRLIYGYGHSDVIHTYFHSHTENEYVSMDLAEKVEFYLIDPSGRVEEKMMQICVRRGFFLNPSQGWYTSVVSAFDVDIAKGSVVVDEHGNYLGILFENDALWHILNGEFDFTIYPRRSFQSILKRIRAVRFKAF
jgi:hypothetical protein